jgi:hypothetical protein
MGKVCQKWSRAIAKRHADECNVLCTRRLALVPLRSRHPAKRCGGARISVRSVAHCSSRERFDLGVAARGRGTLFIADALFLLRRGDIRCALCPGRSAPPRCDSLRGICWTRGAPKLQQAFWHDRVGRACPRALSSLRADRIRRFFPRVRGRAGQDRSGAYRFPRSRRDGADLLRPRRSAIQR